MRLTRCGQRRKLVFGLDQNRLDDPVYQQIRVAPDRAGEVGVGIKRQAKVARIDRRVNGLRHRPQQHGVNLLGIGPVFGGRSNGLELTGRRIVADAQAHASCLQVVRQRFPFLRCGAFVHAVQARMFTLQNEICAADVGRQHRLFNQFVGIVAGSGDDFFDAPTVVTNNLRLCGFKIHGAPAVARFQQRAIHIVQVDQVRHAILATRGLRPFGVGQNGRYFGVGETGMAPHHGGVELVGTDLAV